MQQAVLRGNSCAIEVDFDANGGDGFSSCRLNACRPEFLCVAILREIGAHLARIGHQHA